LAPPSTSRPFTNVPPQPPPPLSPPLSLPPPLPQVGFMVSGIATPLLVGLLNRQGACGPQTMFSIAPNYLVMIATILGDWKSRRDGLIRWKVCYHHHCLPPLPLSCTTLLLTSSLSVHQAVIAATVVDAVSQVMYETETCFDCHVFITSKTTSPRTSTRHQAGI